jgi:hypothetical protein
VLYITSESEADDALRHIRDGEVGFDTEFADRRPTREEYAILQALSTGANKKTALLGWQIVELTMHRIFPVSSSCMDNISLRLTQIAHGHTVWVLDMWKIRGKSTNMPENLPDI